MTLFTGLFYHSISAKADKEEDECELPGCTDKKKVEGTRVHNYCCLDHATQDAPNRAGKPLRIDKTY